MFSLNPINWFKKKPEPISAPHSPPRVTRIRPPLQSSYSSVNPVASRRRSSSDDCQPPAFISQPYDSTPEPVTLRSGGGDFGGAGASGSWSDRGSSCSSSSSDSGSSDSGSCSSSSD